MDTLHDTIGLHCYFMATIYKSACVQLKSPQVLSPCRGGGIVYLNDLDSYASWSLYTPVRVSQVRQVEG